MLPPDGPSPFWANRSSASMWSLIIQEVAARPSPFARSNQSVETRRIDDGQPPRVKQDRGNSVVPERLEVMFQGRDRRHVQLAPEGDPRDPGSRIDDGLEVLAGPHVPFLRAASALRADRLEDRGSGSDSDQGLGSKPEVYSFPPRRIPAPSLSGAMPRRRDLETGPRLRVLVADGPGRRSDEVRSTRPGLSSPACSASAHAASKGSKRCRWRGRSRIRPGCTPVRWVAL